MTPNDYTLTVPQLHDEFHREACPYWTAHRGDRQSEQLGKFRPDTSMARTPEELLIFSWLQLEDLLNRYPRGYLKITTKKNLTDNKSAAITFYVKWGDVYHNSTPMIGNTGQPAGGAPGWDRLFRMQEEAHRREIDLVKDLVLTRAELQNREAEIEGMGEPGIRDTLLLKAMEMLPMVFGGNRPAPGQLGMIDAPAGTEDISVSTSSGSDPAAAPPAQQMPRQLDFGQLQRAAQIIDHSIPNHHPNDVIAALALFCQQNPQMAAGYVDTLMAQVKPDNHG